MRSADGVPQQRKQLIADLYKTAFFISKSEVTDLSPEVNRKKNKLLELFFNVANFTPLASFVNSEMTRNGFCTDLVDNPVHLQMIWANCVISSRLVECMNDFKLIEAAMACFFKFVSDFHTTIDFHFSFFLNSLKTIESEEVLEKVKMILDIYNEFANLFFVFVEKLESFICVGKQMLVDLFPLVEILEKLCLLQIPFMTKNQNNLIILPTSNDEFNGLLTIIKQKSLSVLKRFFNTYNEFGKMFVKKNSKDSKDSLLKMVIDLSFSKVVKSIMESLAFYSVSNELLLFSENQQNLLIECFEVLKLGCKQFEIHGQFADHKQEIFSNIILLNCLTMEAENTLMKENPEDFINLTLQLMEEEHKEMNLKSACLDFT